jgi:hypothetical protein
MKTVAGAVKTDASAMKTNASAMKTGALPGDVGVTAEARRDVVTGRRGRR